MLGGRTYTALLLIAMLLFAPSSARAEPAPLQYTLIGAGVIGALTGTGLVIGSSIDGGACSDKPDICWPRITGIALLVGASIALLASAYIKPDNGLGTATNNSGFGLSLAF